MDLVQAYKKREYDEDLQYLKNFGGKYQIAGLGLKLNDNLTLL